MTEEDRIAKILVRNGFSLRAAASELGASQEALVRRITSNVLLREAICRERDAMGIYAPHGKPQKYKK